mgnify:CR=1 FL=1
MTVQTYPSFTYDGKTYVYEGSNNVTDSTPTYSIVWYRYSSSTGYNVDNNAYGNDYCWHVDGYVTLSDKVAVTYQVKFPGQDAFSNVTADGEPTQVAFVDYATEGTKFSAMTKPGMVDKTYKGGYLRI